MEIVLALVIGALFTAGSYLLLRRSLLKLLIGLSLISHATNLLIFTVGGLTRGRAPVINAEESVITPPFADPVPQALILTAIVISLGVTAFALALAFRAYRSVGTDNLDRMQGTDN